MHFPTILRVLGTLLTLFSLSMLPPIIVSFWYSDGAEMAFITAFLITLGTGLLFRQFTIKSQELKIRDGFLVVVLFWIVLSLFGALPFILSVHLHMTFTNAVFESVSGLTTTGSSMITKLAGLPQSILYYRQQLQFLGGMGIVVLAIAILPMLGIGGMQLYRAEVPGPAKDAKLTPRLTQTAKALWFIYAGLTTLCIFAYWAAGMSFFDAVCESFGTISTGGFSVHDESFAFYHSNMILLISSIFMFLGGVNFSLHFTALRYRKVSTYWQDTEFQVFLTIILLTLAAMTTVLVVYHIYGRPLDALFQALFNLMSVITSTGFTSADIQSWPIIIPTLLLLVGLIGGCAASTSGGMKVIRVLLVMKQGMREFKKLLHPQGIISVKLGNQVISDELLQGVWGFIAVLILLFVIFTIIVTATGIDFSATVALFVCSFSNLGMVVMGGYFSDLYTLNMVSKWAMIVTMLAGRLEIFSLFILFTRAFWQK